MIVELAQAVALNGQRLREERPFTPRETRLLALLLSRVTPLIGTRLATEQHVSIDGLTPRLRDALALLLRDLSEQEIADALYISPKTVHQYVTMLYRHFEVHSRAQLMTYFLARRPKARSDGLRSAR